MTGRSIALAAVVALAIVATVWWWHGDRSGFSSMRSPSVIFARGPGPARKILSGTTTVPDIKRVVGVKDLIASGSYYYPNVLPFFKQIVATGFNVVVVGIADLFQDPSDGLFGWSRMADASQSLPWARANGLVLLAELECTGNSTDPHSPTTKADPTDPINSYGYNFGAWAAFNGFDGVVLSTGVSDVRVPWITSLTLNTHVGYQSVKPNANPVIVHSVNSAMFGKGYIAITSNPLVDRFVSWYNVRYPSMPCLEGQEFLVMESSAGVAAACPAITVCCPPTVTRPVPALTSVKEIALTAGVSRSKIVVTSRRCTPASPSVAAKWISGGAAGGYMQTDWDFSLPTSCV